MSLRTRIILTFTLVVFICLFIAAVVLAFFLQGTRDRIIETQLENKALPIYTQFRSLLSGQSTLASVYADLQEQAESSNIYIIFVNSSGDIVREISPKPNQAQLNIAGSLPHNLTQQTTGKLTTAGGQKLIYVAYPINQASSIVTVTNRLNTLVLATPRTGTAALLASLFGALFWVGLIALIASILIAVLLAHSIYKPVQRLSRAAGDVAQGNYDHKVPAEGPAELKELASNFNDMSAKIKESRQQLRHFVADTSHQLRSPLTSIQGFAQAMLDGTAGDEPSRQKATQIIVDESKRMIRQVNELLELSRIQSGQLKIAHDPVDLRELLQQCVDIFSLRIQEKSLHLINNIGDLPPVTGDSDRLEDVYSNLLDNAIKNTPLMGEIRLDGHSVNHSVEISITDTGPGIPPEQLPYVFVRFHQGTGSRTGTGLGLAIAREIVLAHGGKIEVASNPGEGARFTVTLPVKPV